MCNKHPHATTFGARNHLISLHQAGKLLAPTMYIYYCHKHQAYHVSHIKGPEAIITFTP